MSGDAHDNLRASGDEQQRLHRIRLGLVAGKLRRRLTLHGAKNSRNGKKIYIVMVIVFCSV